jgi:hypothetical protein
MVKVKKLAAGDVHLVGISLLDTLVGWGENDNNQLKFPPNIIKVKDVFAGRYNTFAIKQDDTLIGFGDDTTHQISGIPEGVKFKTIAINQYQVVGIKEDGSIIVWGDKNEQLGLDMATLIPSDMKAKNISINEKEIFVIKEDDTVVVLGQELIELPETLKVRKIRSAGDTTIMIGIDNSLNIWSPLLRTAQQELRIPNISVIDADSNFNTVFCIENNYHVSVIDVTSNDISSYGNMLDYDISVPKNIYVSTQGSVWILYENGTVEGKFVLFEINDPDITIESDNFDENFYNDYDDDNYDRDNYYEDYKLPQIKPAVEMPSDKIVESTIPSKIYDPLMAEDVSINDYISEDSGNVVFIIGNGGSGYPKDQLKNEYLEGSSIVYQCNSQLGLMVTPRDVVMNEPYYKLKLGQGTFLVPLSEFMNVLETTHQIFKLTELKNLEFTAGRHAISVNGLKNLDGHNLNLIGMDHCSAGTNKKAYSVTPIKAVPTGGKNHKKRKNKTRKNKKVLHI